MKKIILLLLLCFVQTCVYAQEEYYPEGTKWTEIRLDTLKYNSWYSKVGDEWVPNFETIEYYVQGEYIDDVFEYKYKKVYTNGPEWTDSLTLLITNGESHGNSNCILVKIPENLGDVPLPSEIYQFDWSVGKRLWFQNMLEANTTCFPPCGLFNYGIIDEIKEGDFGGVRPLKYVDLDGKAPIDQERPWLDYADTKGGRIIQGIGITEWNDGECLFGPANPYLAMTWSYGNRHYRSMLVHFERNNEVLYDVWPRKGSTVEVAIDGLNYFLYLNRHEAVITTNSTCSGELDIPSEVTYEGETFVVKSMFVNSFYNNTELTKVRIPKTIENILHSYPYDSDDEDPPTGMVSPDHMNPFRECTALEAIEVDEENPSFKSINGVLFSQDGVGHYYYLTNEYYGTGLYCYPAGRQQEAYSIPDGVEWIGANAFEGSRNLTTLTIPNSITHIYSCAFQNCNNLTDVYCYADNVPITWDYAFKDTPIASATLHVPAGSVEAYRTTLPWSGFGNIVALPIEINENTFPDDEFRTWVLAQSYGQDGILTEEEIANVSRITVEGGRNIQSLKGIEYFTALTYLNCGSNHLSSLDVSRDTALTNLTCSSNQLTELDVSGCTKLETLNCSWNQLPSLDVSKNAALKELNCQGNQLKVLNLLNNIALENLACNYNQLTSLDVSKNSALTILACIENQLTELNLSRNNLLKRLVCPYNQLTSVNVSGCAALESFRCAGNKLAELDVSGCPALNELICMSNQIKGEAMDALVESLPTVNRGHLGVINHTDEQNVMTKSQVAVAKAKGWYVQYNNDSNQWKNYEGSDDPTSVVADGQLFKPLGLGIETSGDIVADFQPQMYVEGDILYVCTRQGLYSKDLSNDGSEWQLAGFENTPVLDYVRKGDDIYALCFNGKNDIFLLSHDGGLTFEDVTPDDFRSYINREGHTFWYFNRHPTDLDTFLLTSYHGPGMFQTTDFGQTWNKLADYTPDYMGFHPLRPEIIYECGGGGFTDEKTDVRISYDGGQTWQEKAQCFSNYNTVFRMAFHPTDPDKWIAGGNHCVHSTNDNGLSWNTQYLRDYDNTLNEDYMAPWRYAAYDNKNPDVVYLASNSYHGYMKLMCSTDGGESWNRPYLEPIKTTQTEFVFDMKLYGDKLLIYSQSDVYMISKAELIAQTTPVAFTAGQMATIILPSVPDASKGKYYRLDRVEDGQIVFEQELQPQARVPYIIVPSQDFSIDPSSLDLEGLTKDSVSIEGVSFVGSYVRKELPALTGGDGGGSLYYDLIDKTPDCSLSPLGETGKGAIIGALRAYLLVNWSDPYNPGGTRGPNDKLEIVLKDNPNDIKTLSNSHLKGEDIYDLSGKKIVNRKSSNNKSYRGIFIEDGKKKVSR